MKLIFGLGNPGLKYKYTKHNIGFLVLDSLARKYKKVFKLNLFLKARLAQTNIEGCDCILAASTNYMNSCGVSVKALIRKFKIELKDIIVVCDDLNLESGLMKLKAKGGHGGHNGLNSIIESIASKEFARLKIGIDRPKDSEVFSGYVLSEFNQAQRKELPNIVERAVSACELWAGLSIDEAISKFNSLNKI